MRIQSRFCCLKSRMMMFKRSTEKENMDKNIQKVLLSREQIHTLVQPWHGVLTRTTGEKGFFWWGC